MNSDYSSYSDSDSMASDPHKSPVSDSNQPKRVQKDYKDALEALIHMPTMGLKWSNTVAMHNAICYLSGALQGEGDEDFATKEGSSLQSDKKSLKLPAAEPKEVPMVPPQLVKKVPEPNKMEYLVTGPYTYPPVAINIAPKGYHCQNNAQVNEKEQMRKASHNIIERRRREKINELTQTLATLVPACQQRDGLHPTRSACSKVIILEKTITYLQQVTAENEKLKKSVTIQDGRRDSNSVALQAMQNQIAILEKENEFLHKKMKFLPESSSVDDMMNNNESEKTVVAITTTELAELKALEMIRKLLDSVQKRYGQSTRVQEALKELSTKMPKVMQCTCTKSDSDQSCVSFLNNDLADKHKPEIKRKQIKEETATKKVKCEYSDVCEHFPNNNDACLGESKNLTLSTNINVTVNGTLNHNIDT